jgi:hypothetical protein
MQDKTEPETLSSQTSEYVESGQEGEASSSDFNSNDERDQTATGSEHAFSDGEDPLPMPKSAKIKRQKTLFGGLLDDEVDVSLELEPAARSRTATTGARNSDRWSYKGGIDETLPPMHDLGEIFEDITKNALNKGLRAALGHLAGKKLRIATMCSGTESPVLALDLIRDSEQPCWQTSQLRIMADQ